MRVNAAKSSWYVTWNTPGGVGRCPTDTTVGWVALGMIVSTNGNSPGNDFEYWGGFESGGTCKSRDGLVHTSGVKWNYGVGYGGGANKWWADIPFSMFGNARCIAVSGSTSATAPAPEGHYAAVYTDDLPNRRTDGTFIWGPTVCRS